MARRLTDTYLVSSKVTITTQRRGFTTTHTEIALGLFIIPEEIDDFINYIKQLIKKDFSEKFAYQTIISINIQITNIRPL